MASKLEYALVTPARNEAAYIGTTIEAVISQHQRPVRWVIVDDGSTDQTAEVVRQYAERYDFITLVSRPANERRNFGSKVAAINAGLQYVVDTPHDLIGNLDADMVLGPDYYANVVEEFERDSHLGIAGGVIYMPNGDRFITHDTTLDSVGGAVQLFRKECFQQIGGYLPLKSGGIDAAAEIMARMHGWTVRKVANNAVYEQRRTGYASGQPWKASYKEGVHYHKLGYSTVFFCLRCAYRIGNTPVVVGAVLGLLGFLFARLRREPILLPPDVVSYLRSEQTAKMRAWLVKGHMIARVQ